MICHKNVKLWYLTEYILRILGRMHNAYSDMALSHAPSNLVLHSQEGEEVL